MRSHSTKLQLKEKSPEAKFVLSNTLHALLLFKIQKIQTSVSFCVRQLHSRDHSALGTFLATSPSCPELHTRAWSLPGVGSSEPRRRWELLRWLHLPWRPTRARALSPRHPAPPNSPWLSACPCRASARPWHRRRGPASTERAPCRRRAAPPPFRRARPKHPNPGQFST